MARPGKAIFDVTMMAGWAFVAVLTVWLPSRWWTVPAQTWVRPMKLPHWSMTARPL